MWKPTLNVQVLGTSEVLGLGLQYIALPVAPVPVEEFISLRVIELLLL